MAGFDAAAFGAVPGFATVPDLVGAVATVLRVVDCLGAAFVAGVFATVDFRAAVSLVPARRLEPVVSLALAISVAVTAAFGSRDAVFCPAALRPDADFLAARFGFLVAPWVLVLKASATTASASSNVSYRVSIATFMVRSSFLRCAPEAPSPIGKPTIGCPSSTIVDPCAAHAARL